VEFARGDFFVIKFDFRPEEIASQSSCEECCHLANGYKWSIGWKI